MENTLEDRVSMFQKVIGGLETYKELFVELPVVEDHRVELNSRVSTILNVASLAGRDITGYTVDKQARREDVTYKIRMLSTSLVVYAVVKKKRNLLETADATESEINAMRDNDFYAYAKMILNTAEPMMNMLVPYGVSLVDYSNAEKAVQDYFVHIQDPRIQISERGRHIEELEDLVDDTSKFLREKMDMVMQLFSVRNPTLYVLYKNLRGIDGTGAVTTPDYKGVVPAGSIALVADLKYSPARTFEFYNLGKVPIEFALSATELKIEGNVSQVLPNKPVTARTADLNANTKASKLYVQNNGTEPAEYKVNIID